MVIGIPVVIRSAQVEPRLHAVVMEHVTRQLVFVLVSQGGEGMGTVLRVARNGLGPTALSS